MLRIFLRKIGMFCWNLPINTKSLIEDADASIGFWMIECDNFYHPEADGGISILDDTLGIDWKIPTEHANLSEKDTKHAMLKDFDSPFDINMDLYKQVNSSCIN